MGRESEPGLEKKSSGSSELERRVEDRGGRGTASPTSSSLSVMIMALAVLHASGALERPDFFAANVTTSNFL